MNFYKNIKLTILRMSILGISVFSSITVQAENPTNQRHLTFTSSASCNYRPDTALINFSVSEFANSAGEAISKHAKKNNSLIAAAKKLGINNKFIKTQHFNLSPYYSNRNQPYYQDRKCKSDNAICGYEAKSTISLKTTDLKKLGVLIDKLVTSGANGINNLNFSGSNLKKCLENAKVTALKNGLTEAKMLSEAANVKLGPLISIKASQSYDRPELMTRSYAIADESSLGQPQIEVGQNSINASFTLVFKIN